jgi:hypothetical protein
MGIVSNNILGMLIFCISTIVTGQTSKTIIAVNELMGQGVDKATSGIVSDRLRAELINTGAFRVMERAEMENILKEQGFQRTGACDKSCLVEAGQLLGVDRMIAGTVGNVGGLWTISVRMINVATGEILYSVNEDYEGQFKEVLSTIVAKVAARLVANAGNEVRKSIFEGNKGDLFIDATEPGASIEIDGQPMEGVTPITLQGFAAGEHRIIARKDNWFGSQTITLNPEDLLKVHLKMTRGTGTLKIFSEPVGAEIMIDGNPAGITPIKLTVIMAGEHEVIARKQGYIDARQSLRLAVNETQNLNLTLQPAAWLTVTVLPKQAIIKINGKECGSGTIQELAVPAGQVDIQMEATGFKAIQEQITLSHMEKTSVERTLTSVFGCIAFQSTPTGAKLFLNDREVGTTPYSNDRVTPGTYQARMFIKGYDTCSRQFELTAGERKQFFDTLISLYGALTLKSAPNGAIVFIDGKQLCPAPCSVSVLLPGYHKVKLEATGYAPITDSVLIIQNKVVPKSWSMQHSKVYLDSVAAYTQHKQKSKQWTRRILFGSAAFGATVAGVYYNRETDRAYNEYLNLNYENQHNVDSHWNAVESSRKKRNVFYIAAALFTAAFSLSIPF